MFVTAAARHFGDAVTTWSIWNEPNHPQFLRPQFDRTTGRSRRGIYREPLLRGPARLRTRAGMPSRAC